MQTGSAPCAVAGGAGGADFAASATYKWLMGDFGLAFFYVREDLLGRVIQRPHWSYESAADADIHMSPFDPEYPTPVTWTPRNDVTGYFTLGTMAMFFAGIGPQFEGPRPRTVLVALGGVSLAVGLAILMTLPAARPG